MTTTEPTTTSPAIEAMQRLAEVRPDPAVVDAIAELAKLRKAIEPTLTRCRRLLESLDVAHWEALQAFEPHDLPMVADDGLNETLSRLTGEWGLHGELLAISVLASPDHRLPEVAVEPIE